MFHPDLMSPFIDTRQGAPPPSTPVPLPATHSTQRVTNLNYEENLQQDFMDEIVHDTINLRGNCGLFSATGKLEYV